MPLIITKIVDGQEVDRFSALSVQEAEKEIAKIENVSKSEIDYDELTGMFYRGFIKLDWWCANPDQALEDTRKQNKEFLKNIGF